jgi:hypothetical protein
MASQHRPLKTFDWLSILLVALGIAGLIIALVA